uniref:ATP synthase subunit b, chloroplastic n=1 Tax=Streptosarcina moshanensis TaxID=3096259 RepID=A0AAU7LJU4_9VIRI|nr:CF0 subunit I of ATP synthase [Streptosarcina costaricana]WKT08952.1 CF0 subunit I of ATP synthase [Streptosarcina costaricana]
MLTHIWSFWAEFSLGEGWGLNGDPLETNLINLGVVLGTLFYFGQGSLNSLLSNRKETILSAIRDADARYEEATEKLKQAKARLEQAKAKAESIRVEGLAQMKRENLDLMKAAEEDSKRLEDSKNATIRLEEQRAIEEVRRQVSRLALEKASEALKRRFRPELHARMIDHCIGLLSALETTN